MDVIRMQPNTSCWCSYCDTSQLYFLQYAKKKGWECDVWYREKSNTRMNRMKYFLCFYSCTDGTFSGYSQISGFGYLSESSKNYFEKHFQYDFSAFKIPTLPWTHTCSCHTLILSNQNNVANSGKMDSQINQVSDFFSYSSASPVLPSSSNPLCVTNTERSCIGQTALPRLLDILVVLAGN